MAESAEQAVVLQLVADIQDFVSKMSKEVPNAVESGFSNFEDIVNEHTEAAGKALENFSEKAAEEGKKAGEEFTKGFVLAAAAGAAEFLNHMREAVESASEYASSLSTLSIITGDNSKRLQQFEYAMRSVGVSTQESQQSLSMFQRRIQESAGKAKDTDSAFHKLGLSAKSMVGQDAITSFEQVSDKIAALKNSADKTSIAMELFGRNGARYLSVLDGGKASIEALMGAAEGAVIPEKLLKSLEEYDEAMKRCEQVTRAFFAVLAGPIIPLLTRMEEGIIGVESAFEKLSQQQQLAVLIGSLSVAFIAFEQGLRTIGGFMKGLINEELLDFMADFAAVFRIVIIAIVALAAAWQTNFADIRGVAQPVLDAIAVGMHNVREAAREIGDYIQATLGPAMQDLSIALTPVLKNFGDWVETLLRSKEAINDVVGVIKTIIDRFADVLGALKDVVTKSGDLATALGILAALAFPAVRTAVIALLPQLQFMLLYMTTMVTEAIPAFVIGLASGLVPAIKAFIAVLYSTAAAEDVASLGITLLIQALVFLVSAGIAYALLHWQEFSLWLSNTWSTVLQAAISGIGIAVGAFGDLATAFAGVLQYVPGLQTFASGLRDVGTEAHNAATELQGLADAEARRRALRNIKFDGPDGGVSEGDYQSVYGPPKAPPEKPKPPGTAALEPSDSNKDGTSDWLAGVKQGAESLKESLSKIQNDIALTQAALKKLGDIDSMAKVREKQKLLNQEYRQTQEEIRRQTALTTEYGSEAARVQRMLDATSDPKKKRELQSAENELKAARDASSLKQVEEDSGKLNALVKERREAEFDYQKTLASEAPTWNARIAAANQMLYLAQRLHLSLKDQAEAQKTLLDAEKARDDAALGIEKTGTERSRLAVQGAALGRAGAAAARPKQTADQMDEAAHAKAVADAQDALATATDAVTDAKAEETARVREAAKALQIYREGSIEAILAQTAADTATNNVTKAQQDELKAQQALTKAQNDTLKSVTDVRNSFDQLIKSAVGPLYNIITGLNGNVTNLATGFISLFQQSNSYADIQRVMTNITKALSQVFDAFRPIIDLLLGVVTGVVNVFLTLYNLLADVLNVFGLNIQKIKLVNDQLDGLSAQPLLQITHDLPTMNEYNSGKWSDLVAASNSNANTTNNTLTNGFSQSLNKFGQMIGWLIGIHVILQGIAALEALNKMGGGGGGIGGLINDVKTFFSGKPQGVNPFSNDAGQSSMGDASSGGWGGSDGSGTNLGTNSNPIIMDIPNDADSNFQDVLTQSSSDNLAIIGRVTATNGFSNDAGQADMANGASGGWGSAASSTASVGSQIVSQIGNAFKAAGIGGLAAGLTGGNSTNGAIGGLLGSGLGNIIGTLGGATGGPLGQLIGSALGGLIGGMFGPHETAAETPDVSDTATYGPDIANLQGETINANGQSFSPSAQFQTEGAIEQISQAIAAGNDSGLTAAQIAEFKGANGIVNGSQGNLTLDNGVTEYWTQLVQDASDALQNLTTSTGTLTDMLNSATDVNLASMFGNGTTVTSAGAGVNINSGGNSSLQSPQMTVNIGTINGTDAATVQAALQPTLDEFGRQVQIVGRTQATLVGRT